jgi:hypothetical protein
MGQDGLVRALEGQIAHLVSEIGASQAARDEALAIAEARLQVLEAYRTAAAERLRLIDDLNARLTTDAILATLSGTLAGLEARIGAIEANREQQLSAVEQAAEIRMRALEDERDAASSQAADRLEHGEALQRELAARDNKLIRSIRRILLR